MRPFILTLLLAFASLRLSACAPPAATRPAAATTAAIAPEPPPAAPDASAMLPRPY